MKEEALKLADELSQYTINDGVDDLNKRTIAMIRRLVEELDKKKVWCDCGDSIEPNCGAICGNCLASMNTTPQTKPLSDEEILEILIDKGICGRLKDGSLCYWQADADLHDFARAIEKEHGIK